MQGGVLQPMAGCPYGTLLKLPFSPGTIPLGRCNQQDYSMPHEDRSWVRSNAQLLPGAPWTLAAIAEALPPPGPNMQARRCGICLRYVGKSAAADIMGTGTAPQCHGLAGCVTHRTGSSCRLQSTAGLHLRLSASCWHACLVAATLQIIR